MGRTLVLAAAARRGVVDRTPRATAHAEARLFVVFSCYLLLSFCRCLPQWPQPVGLNTSPCQQRCSDAEEVRRTGELDKSCRNAQHAQALHDAQHDLASLLLAQMAKQFDRAEPGESGPDEESCEQSDAAVGFNSKDDKDSPDREKILRVSYARGHGYQGRESRPHIGPLLVLPLLLLRQSQEHAPAHDEQQRDPAQDQDGALKERIFEHLQRSDGASEKVGDDEEHQCDNEIADRATRNDRGRHCSPLLDAKMQTPNGNRTGWEPDGGAGLKSQQAAAQAP